MEKKEKPISYYSKQKVSCPICQEKISREELLTGSGRLIAGNLTPELRRLYEPSKKSGVVYPLIYGIGICPSCYLSLIWHDYECIAPKDLEKVRAKSQERFKSVQRIFPHFDLSRNRTLFDGAAIYFFALLTYEEIPLSYSPTIKRALISLRLAWLCGEIHRLLPNYNYDFIQKTFYQKANFFYTEAVIREGNGAESITNILSFGPDIDKNFGYDGAQYLSCLLEFLHGQKEDKTLRLRTLGGLKIALSRLFGLGKSSRQKPGPLLDHARDLFEDIRAELKDAKELGDEFNDIELE
ncbi:MAG: DUF2225 domain-containing protein [Treponemataceae bacterium]